jgi:uncharacterized protein YndB with AHSA1/START domain
MGHTGQTRSASEPFATGNEAVAVTAGTFKVTINSPAEAVWPWINDVEKHAEWSPKPYRMVWISGEPNQVESRFRSSGWIPGDKEHANECEIVQNDPPRAFALRADDSDGAYQNRYELHPMGDRTTEVTYSLEFPAEGHVGGGDPDSIPG